MSERMKYLPEDHEEYTRAEESTDGSDEASSTEQASQADETKNNNADRYQVGTPVSWPQAFSPKV